MTFLDRQRGWGGRIRDFLRPVPLPDPRGASTTRVTIAPHVDGRPGEAFDAPARPVREPRVVDPQLGTRMDALVFVDRLAAVAVSCVGRVVVHGDAETRSRRTAIERGGIGRPEDEPIARTTALGSTFVTAFRDQRRRVVMWEVDRAGWAYSIVLADDQDRSGEAFVSGPLAAAEVMLASWTWIDPPTVQVETPCAADGRPGHRFVAPRASIYGPRFDRAGARQDVLVPLGDGVHLIVQSLGRLGEDLGEGPVRPDRIAADERARFQLDQLVLAGSARRPMSAVTPVVSAAGEGSRVAFAQGNMVVVDTNLDHEGWGFIVGVVGRLNRGQDVATLSSAADAVLATWTWVDAPRP